MYQQIISNIAERQPNNICLEIINLYQNFNNKADSLVDCGFFKLVSMLCDEWPTLKKKKKSFLFAHNLFIVLHIIPIFKLFLENGRCQQLHQRI